MYYIPDYIIISLYNMFIRIHINNKPNFIILYPFLAFLNERRERGNIILGKRHLHADNQPPFGKCNNSVSKQKTLYIHNIRKLTRFYNQTAFFDHL